MAAMPLFTAWFASHRQDSAAAIPRQPGFGPRQPVIAAPQDITAKITRTKTKKLSGLPGEPKTIQFFSPQAPIRLPRVSAASLVRAAREQRHQHHQVRQGKQPLVRLNPR